jgi:integrase
MDRGGDRAVRVRASSRNKGEAGACTFAVHRAAPLRRCTHGRQHVRDGLLHVKQDKTGAELFIPIHAELQQIIAASSVGQMTFLVTEFGKPFSSVGFSNWFRKQCDKAGLPECTSHGLRKACARRLADAGCSQHEIAAITGHASLKEIVRYTKGADQLRLARAAMQKMRATVQENETRSSTVNADDGLTKKAKIS